jgi:hypothetical protein
LTAPAASPTSAVADSAAAATSAAEASTAPTPPPAAVAGHVVPATAEPPVVDEPMVRHAAALRFKYRRPGGLVRIPVEQVGFHPKNRDGQPPNGSRCMELFKEILDVGFDTEESNNGGIVVEARPGSTEVHEFNREACDGDPYHVPVVTGWIAYGSLSHSHLHQVLRNIRGGGPCNIPEVSELGKYSLPKLRAEDAGFYLAAETGLLWDILSSAIEDEEPDGCAIIQAAMNAKNTMFLMRHEMQALAALVQYTHASAVAERALSLDAARRKLKATCPEFASDPNFLDLYRFVIDLGSGAASFLPDLRSFHERFVDPKVRRLRLIDFAAMNLFPSEMPYLKVAGIKFAYACDVKHVRQGFCEAVSAKGVRGALATAGLKAVAGEADGLLDFFHRCCLPDGQADGSSSAVAGKNKSTRTKFLGNLDKDVFAILLGTLSEAPRRVKLLDACGHAYLQMLQLFPGASFPSYPHALPAAVAAGPTAGNAVSKADVLVPLVIDFVDGKPVTQQASVVEGVRLERFHWSAFMETAEAARPLDEEAIRSVVVGALSTLRRHQEGGGEDMHILRGGEQKALRVVAARDIKKGQLKIAPLVNHPMRIVAHCQQGWAPQVVVRHGGQRTTMHLTGTASFPAIRQGTLARSMDEWAAASAVADGGALFGDHEWKANNFPWPFWAIKRGESAEGTNCSFVEYTINTVHTNTADEKAVDVFEVVVPVIVNHHDISKGTELIAHWPGSTAAPKRKDPKLTVSTWVQQANKKTKH